MSIKRITFESEVNKPFPDWTKVVDNLSALAMFEMLPALAGLAATLRQQVVSQAWKLLSVERGWKGSYDRIDFAADVVTDQKVDQNDSRVPADQIDDATNFLIELLKPANSRAAQVGFANADDAAVAALQEIAPTTKAVGLEFAGSIYSLSGTFRFTAPKKGDATGSDSNVPVPVGTKAVAIYHTHPTVGTNYENFSPQDLMICRGNQQLRLPPRFSYLGTPSGRIKKLIPPDLLTGQDKDKFGILGKQVILR